MARDLTAAFITEITTYSPDDLAPVILLNAAFDSGNLRLWTGIGDLVYDSNTYTGAGNILGWQPIKENKDLSAKGIEITLTGLNSTILDLAHDEPYQERSLELYTAVLDSNGAVVADAYLMFEGFMDVMKIVDDGNKIDIMLRAENALIVLERPLDTKYTPEDQQREFPGDTGLNFMTDNQNKEVVWG